MPSCHTHVGLIQYVVALAEVFVISTSIDQIHSERVGSAIVARYIQFVVRIAIDGRLLAYLKYGFVVGLCATGISRTSRNVLREQRLALLFAWCSVLGEASVHLHSIANDEALVVGVYTSTYPYNLRFESRVVLVKGIVLGCHFHSQLQSAYVSFLAVVVYTIIIGFVYPVKLVGIALIVLVPDLLQTGCIIG